MCSWLALLFVSPFILLVQIMFSLFSSGHMKWVKRGLQYFCVVVLTLEQQNKPKQTPVCMGSMSNVDGDVKQPYRRPSVCGSGRLAETTLFIVSHSDTVVLL